MEIHSPALTEMTDVQWLAYADNVCVYVNRGAPRSEVVDALRRGAPITLGEAELAVDLADRGLCSFSR